MMRSGLSKDEMDNMPITLFWKLYIFDTYLEPQSPAFQDMQNAMLQYSMYMTSQGMTRETARKLKPSQFQLIREENSLKLKKNWKNLHARKKKNVKRQC